MAALLILAQRGEVWDIVVNDRVGELMADDVAVIGEVTRPLEVYVAVEWAVEQLRECLGARWQGDATTR
jgi:hypothetical protein